MGESPCELKFPHLPAIPATPILRLEKALASNSNVEGSLAEGCHSDGSQPDLEKLSKIAEQVTVQLPAPFVRFLHSPDLYRKIRSCTDCYLDVADRAVKVKGSDDGYLIHFLSDSQWVCHWYIFVRSSGDHVILASFDAYGFNVDDVDDPSEDEDDDDATCRKNEIELKNEALWLCSVTFTEFIYRFWLENEIWFGLSLNEHPLTSTQQAYVDHYKNDCQ